MGGGQILTGTGCPSQPPLGYLVGELGSKGVGWYLRWSSSSCTQMLVTLQLLQLDSPPVAVVLCFGRTEGGRAGEEGRSGKSTRSLATLLPSIPPPPFILHYFLRCIWR